MKASRMIELLQKTIENHGDLEVIAYDRLNENDGFVRKVTVRESDEDGNMEYDCSNDSVVDTPDTEYVVLFTN